MKRFNEMTEKEMSEVNGGLIGLAIAGFIGMVGAIVGAAYGTVQAGNAIKKK